MVGIAKVELATRVPESMISTIVNDLGTDKILCMRTEIDSAAPASCARRRRSEIAWPESGQTDPRPAVPLELRVTRAAVNLNCCRRRFMTRCGCTDSLP
jgi:DNA-directed RNA polymerase subunit N (RpoN/RPB10)